MPKCWTPKSAQEFRFLACLKKMHLRYVQKNPAEARAVYYDQDEIIQLFFRAGFRQVIIQGLKVPESPHSGVFSLIAATK